MLPIYSLFFLLSFFSLSASALLCACTRAVCASPHLGCVTHVVATIMHARAVPKTRAPESHLSSVAHGRPAAPVHVPTALCSSCPVPPTSSSTPIVPMHVQSPIAAIHQCTVVLMVSKFKTVTSSSITLAAMSIQTPAKSLS